ncbi:MAG: glutamyl-Q tRNA(Asp) synthetase [Patiriisocius sp.]|jgi:glutamyl-Q tRNA(Asp) synthetase
MTDTVRLSSAKQSSTASKCASLYCGRFAPSPSGPLHFGSLLCALASYLHAKRNNGRWLVRIEDIDTPRVEKHTIQLILDTLQAHGLHWDDEVLFQSQRQHIYTAYLSKLQHSNYLYACACSRRQIRARSGSYDGHCRDKGLPFTANSTRFKHTTNNSEFVDLFWGKRHITHNIATEDPVLKRADGIFCYHLAVVLDDIEQKVTHIVRGYDLLDTTPVHLSLFQALSERAPEYMHIPMVVQKPHEKLSKQHYSPAIDNAKALENLKMALTYLGLNSEKMTDMLTVDQILSWAITNWQPKLMPKQSELLISVVNGVYSQPENLLATFVGSGVNKTSTNIDKPE